MPSRRAFLSGLATAGAAAATPPAARTVAATQDSSRSDDSDGDDPEQKKEDYEHWQTKSEHIRLEYDQPFLERYVPKLSMKYATRQKFNGIYGWVARSTEYDTDICTYWCEYSHQEGWLGNLDSHDGDHEPLAVEVDSETGDVETIWGSIYHWTKGQEDAALVPMDGKQARLRVFKPHHHYTAAKPKDNCTAFTVQNLHDKFTGWLANGLASALYPGSTTTPWVMKSRPHYWREGEDGISTNAAIVSAFRTFNPGDVGGFSAGTTTSETRNSTNTTSA